MYLAIKMGKDTPWELIKWSLIERFGWTPEEFGKISLADLHEFLQVEEGRQKAKAQAPKRKGPR